jgi:hypothetical protein
MANAVSVVVGMAQPECSGSGGTISKYMYKDAGRVGEGDDVAQMRRSTWASDFQFQAVRIFDEDRGEPSRLVAVFAQDLGAFFFELFGRLIDIVGNLADCEF